MLPRVHLRELGAEKENVRRPVNPHHQDDERSRRAICRSDGALAEVETEAEFADDEEERSEAGAEPDVAPCRMNVGKKSKDHREQNGDDEKRDEQLNRLPQSAADRRK